MPENDKDLWGVFVRDVIKLADTNKVKPHIDQKPFSSRLDHFCRPALEYRTTESPLMTRKQFKRFRSDFAIDLHGLTAAQAVLALERGVTNGMALGVKYITIVTGKGGGKLKETAVKWLKESAVISAFYPITDKSGGVGSYAVALKKRQIT